jgi:hypothetical protein
LITASTTSSSSPRRRAPFFGSQQINPQSTRHTPPHAQLHIHQVVVPYLSSIF